MRVAALSVSAAIAMVTSAAAPPSDESNEPKTAAQASTDTAERPVVKDTIQVVGQQPEVPTVVIVKPRQAPPFGDGGEALLGAPGVSGGRMGGHGFEPVVRGLGAASLNVRLDGAAIHGGCPNRMDPQSSFAAPWSYDRVVVIRGVQSFQNGAGGSAGTVLYERLPPALGETTGWRATLGASYGSALDGPTGDLDFAFGRDRLWLRVLAGRQAQRNYRDGDGRTVRSAFKSRSAAVTGAWRPSSYSRLEASLESSRTDDALFAGAGMDAPEDASDIARLDFSAQIGLTHQTGLEATVYGDRVDHLMDNYSLRPLTAPMAMRVPASSDSTGARLRLDFVAGPSWRLVAGLDVDRNRRDATRFAGPTAAAVTMVQSVMWPDVAIAATGGFVEAGRTLGAHSRLRLGLRVDRFTADAAGADRPTMGDAGPTPRQLWSMTYGASASLWRHTAVSALARWEWRGDALELFAGASRSVRAPDATERFLAANNPQPGMRWVGNPGLAAPRHHQLDLGLVWHRGGERVTLTAFGDEVDDLVLRDRARGQEGVAVADLRSIYRNVDARRLGAELEANADLGRGARLTAVASWVRADNRTDHRPIAQTPPLEGSLSAAWTDGVVSCSTSLRWAARQSRVDDSPLTGSGLDTGPTPGWVAVDLGAGVQLGVGFSLTAGVDNVFDRTYARHLNRGSLFDPVPVQVNEPGRTAWLRLTWHSEGG
ncbi:MAG: TonB-dependent receptor [Acidobacteria bacterium]|nr:TonB-dependent receptor [Acidobacteriota bacterium]